MPESTIRQFHRTDLPEVIALYERVMTPLAPRYSRTLSREQLERQYFGHTEFREECLFVAESAGELVGFSFGALRLHPITPEDTLPGVFVCMLLVDERYRRQGIGTELMERLAQVGLRNGKTLLSAHSNPMNPLAFWPGVNRAWTDAVAFLEARGFCAKYYEVSMDQCIENFVLSDYVLQQRETMTAQGFRVIPYEPRFHDSLLAIAGWPFWHIDLLSKIEVIDHPFIETAFLDVDMAHIYGPDDITLVVRGEDELVGFVVLCRNPGETISYLGPIRIIEKYKGCGLGSVMIQMALLRERERGIHTVDLWCSPENAAGYYGRNGFVQRDVWDSYERAL